MAEHDAIATDLAAVERVFNLLSIPHSDPRIGRFCEVYREESRRFLSAWPRLRAALQPPDASIDAAAPWAEMLAQAETIFRNVLETSPVLAELRARLDALQSATARATAIEREPSTPQAILNR